MYILVDGLGLGVVSMYSLFMFSGCSSMLESIFTNVEYYASLGNFDLDTGCVRVYLEWLTEYVIYYSG